MTVKELRNALVDFDDNAEVYLKDTIFIDAFVKADELRIYTAARSVGRYFVPKAKPYYPGDHHKQFVVIESKGKNEI